MKNINKVDILAIGVHPDDVELSSSGTLLRQASKGNTFALLDLTQGELGSRGTRETRKKEASKAAQILGAQERVMLDMGDGFFKLNKKNTLQIIQYIRFFQPKVVLCNALNDRHPDHGRAAQLVAEACFYSGLLKIKTKCPVTGKKQEKWRPKSVYHYIQDRSIEPDFVVDITPFYEKKLESILAYSTQFFVEDMKGPKTPISGKPFLDFMEGKARTFGRPIGVEYAEGFNVARTMGVDDIMGLL